MRIGAWLCLVVVGLLAASSSVMAQWPVPGTNSMASAYYQSDSYYAYQDNSDPLSSSAVALALAYPAMPSNGSCSAMANVDNVGNLRAGCGIQAQLAYPDRSADNLLRNVASDGAASQVIKYRVTSSDPATTTVRIVATFNVRGRLAIEGFVGHSHRAEASVSVSGLVWNAINTGGGETMMAENAGSDDGFDGPYNFLYAGGSVSQWYFDGVRTPWGLATDAPLTITNVGQTNERYSYDIYTAVNGSFEAAPDTDIAVQWTLATSALIWEATSKPTLSEDGLVIESIFADGSSCSVVGYDPERMWAQITLTPVSEGSPTVEAGTNLPWVYQNTPTTTGNRHLAVLTVAVSDLSGYSVDVRTFGGTGEVVIQPTADPLVWNILGGPKSTGGAGTGPVTLLVQVSGRAMMLMTEVDLTVRALGDLDGVGGVNGQDKLLINKRLSGLVPNGPEFDLDCAGGCNGQDKLILNKILSGIAIP